MPQSSSKTCRCPRYVASIISLGRPQSRVPLRVPPIASSWHQEPYIPHIGNAKSPDDVHATSTTPLSRHMTQRIQLQAMTIHPSKSHFTEQQLRHQGDLTIGICNLGLLSWNHACPLIFEPAPQPPRPRTLMGGTGFFRSSRRLGNMERWTC